LSQKRLDPKKAGLLIVDVQEKLFPLVEHPCEILEKMQKLIKGCNLFHLKTIVSEQYPKGLGTTIEPLKEVLPSDAVYFSKTAFGCSNDPVLKEAIEKSGRSQWIVAGIEAHVCIYQTVRGLIDAGKQVVVVNDAISSRDIYDFSSAIAEMRDLGARIASVETVLFDLMEDASRPEFRDLSALIKS
jgi:nicotinamidase-related amidase